MSDKPIEATFVGKWSVGFQESQGLTLLMFDFTDKVPINLALSRDQAEQIAKAIQDQLRNSPSKPRQMN